MSQLQVQMREALLTEEPSRALHSIVAYQLNGGGMQTSSVLEDLEELRLMVRGEGLEDAEDYVLEVMDYVSGWCSPRMRLGS